MMTLTEPQVSTEMTLTDPQVSEITIVRRWFGNDRGDRGDVQGAQAQAGGADQHLGVEGAET